MMMYTGWFEKFTSNKKMLFIQPPPSSSVLDLIFRLLSCNSFPIPQPHQTFFFFFRSLQISKEYLRKSHQQRSSKTGMRNPHKKCKMLIFYYFKSIKVFILCMFISSCCARIFFILFKHFIVSEGKKKINMSQAVISWDRFQLPSRPRLAVVLSISADSSAKTASESQQRRNHIKA